MTFHKRTRRDDCDESGAPGTGTLTATVIAPGRGQPVDVCSHHAGLLDQLRAGCTSVRIRRRHLAALILVLAVVLAHGHALGLGFWFDDHNHLELCRQNGFSNLTGGNHFDWTGRIARVWWAQKATAWTYFRPLTVAVRVLILDVCGLNPVAFHLVHESLFGVSVLLFFGLLVRLGFGDDAALGACLLFVIHPSLSLTVCWLANDGPVLVGLLTIYALRLMRRSVRAGHQCIGLWTGLMVCYLLAMLSRENGVMLGPMLVVFDIVQSHFKRKGASAQPTQASRARRLFLYAALAAEAIGFLVIRSWRLGDAPCPRSPYFHWPSEPGFGAWLAYKLLDNVLSLPLGLPLLPIADVPWLQSRPVASWLALALLAAMVGGIAYPLRRSAVFWGLAAGIGLALAPTIPAFSAAYNFYLAAAGWAVMLVLWARHQWARRPKMVASALTIVAGFYLVGLWSGSWVLRSAAAVERSVIEEVLTSRPERQPPGARLFFINMPFFAAESGPSLRLRTQRGDLEVFPLTMSPDLFLPRGGVSIVRENERTLRLESQGRRWFSGMFGELVQLGWFGTMRSDLTLGTYPAAPAAGAMPFRVEVLDVEPEGIKALRFVFDRPLDDKGYQFFVTSPDHGARCLRFESNYPKEIDSALRTPGMAQTDNPEQAERLGKVRRMQSAYDLVTTWLAKCP